MSDLPKNTATWFSIPALDFEKSVKFYEGLLKITLQRESMGEGDEAVPYGMFPYAGGDGVTGAVTPAVKVQPADGGVLVYLLATDLDDALARVESLGGSVVSGRTPLPENMGDIAVIKDCEGTPIGLHQP